MRFLTLLVLYTCHRLQ